MQTRFSTCRGMEIVEESTGDVLGYVLNILIHPDKGTVLGFYVLPIPGVGGGGTAYVSALDILHFGTRIAVRDEHAICDPQDIVRLQGILEDRRRILGQRMRTEGGVLLGRCADIQFDSETMQTDWLFPRKFFWWKMAVPMREVLEVRRDAIIIQNSDTTVSDTEDKKETLFTAPLSEPSL